MSDRVIDAAALRALAYICERNGLSVVGLDPQGRGWRERS